jgi:hypothetical protein
MFRKTIAALFIAGALVFSTPVQSMAGVLEANPHQIQMNDTARTQVRRVWWGWFAVAGYWWSAFLTE